MSESAVQQMGISEARANLTEVIAKVRLLGQQVVLTRREKPQAVLVSHDFYEEAVENARIVEALKGGWAPLYEQIRDRNWSGDST